MTPGGRLWVSTILLTVAGCPRGQCQCQICLCTLRPCLLTSPMAACHVLWLLFCVGCCLASCLEDNVQCMLWGFIHINSGAACCILFLSHWGGIESLIPCNNNSGGQSYSKSQIFSIKLIQAIPPLSSAKEWDQIHHQLVDINPWILHELHEMQKSHVLIINNFQSSFFVHLVMVLFTICCIIGVGEFNAAQEQTCILLIITGYCEVKNYAV